MKKGLKTLLLWLAIPLVTGGVASLLTHNAMKDFELLRLPPLSPPAWVFPVVWTILYIMMGLASYLVAVSQAPKAKRDAALRVYGLQLAFNFLWTFIYFTLKLYLAAFIWLLLLWALIVLTIVRFRAIDRRAAALLAPYLLWAAFAGYLNLGVWLLNR